mgnify:CR=1 FL=1
MNSIISSNKLDAYKDVLDTSDEEGEDSHGAKHDVSSQSESEDGGLYNHDDENNGELTSG